MNEDRSCDEKTVGWEKVRTAFEELHKLVKTQGGYMTVTFMQVVLPCGKHPNMVHTENLAMIEDGLEAEEVSGLRNDIEEFKKLINGTYPPA